MTQIVPIILCGGSGSRLWPLSRLNYPKQFLPLVTESSLLQDTINRLPLNCLPPIFVCHEEHRFLVAEQVRLFEGDTKIILEPEGRNTAPAIALAAFQVIKENPDAILLVLASDHVIQNVKAFHRAIAKAEVEASQSKLVTFGITPTTPETGYGYIKQGRKFSSSSYEIDAFIEKPNIELAKKYLESTDTYLWNSGMFMFKVSDYLNELKKYRPNIFVSCQKAMENVVKDVDFLRPNKESFFDCVSESIDYAVMENTLKGCVIPLKDVEWNDIGSYNALWEMSEQDENRNVLKGDVLAVDSTYCYINASHKLIATLGVDNLIIVDTPDAVLVASKDNVQNIKSIVKKLKESNRSEYSLHKKVYRPWGKYNTIDSGDRFQVKRITVNPGKKLSMQKHHYRAEHWVVVSGCAKVTIDKKVSMLTENQSVYIPAEAIHTLENPGELPLEIIEIQSGSYFGEDDIVRYQNGKPIATK